MTARTLYLLQSVPLIGTYFKAKTSAEHGSCRLAVIVNIHSSLTIGSGQHRVSRSGTCMSVPRMPSSLATMFERPARGNDLCRSPAEVT